MLVYFVTLCYNDSKARCALESLKHCSLRCASGMCLNKKRKRLRVEKVAA